MIKLMNTKQAAAMLNLSAATLISWRAKKLSSLNYYKLGRRVVYLEADVLDWLKTNQATDCPARGYF